MTWVPMVQWRAAARHPCGVCGTLDPQKPMIFRGAPWCCEKHRKILAGES